MVERRANLNGCRGSGMGWRSWSFSFLKVSWLRAAALRSRNTFGLVTELSFGEWDGMECDAKYLLFSSLLCTALEQCQVCGGPRELKRRYVHA